MTLEKFKVVVFIPKYVDFTHKYYRLLCIRLINIGECFRNCMRTKQNEST